MRIRLATIEDMPALAKLVGHTCEELQTEYGSPRMDSGILALISYGISTGQAVVVAEQQLELIGWCARVMAPGFEPGVTQGVGKWTFAPFRREHVCRDMCRLADEHAYRMGARLLLGEVEKDNLAGVRSALADGWEITGYVIRKKLTDGKERHEEAAPTEAVLEESRCDS